MVTVRADAKFCTPKCGTYYRRKLRKLPPQMTKGARFVRAEGKIPMQITGRRASSTNPATWSSFAEVQASSVGDGWGVILGGGLGCYDFDDCLDESGQIESSVREVIEAIPERVLFVERSVSGRGLHVFVEAEEGPGRCRDGIERYTRERFIRVTGDRYQLV